MLFHNVDFAFLLSLNVRKSEALPIIWKKIVGKNQTMEIKNNL